MSDDKSSLRNIDKRFNFNRFIKRFYSLYTIDRLFVLILCYLFYSINVSVIPIGDDEGSFLYSAWRFSQGDLFPVEGLSNTPLAIYLVGILFIIFGSNFIIARVFSVCMLSLSGLILYEISRKLHFQRDERLLIIVLYCLNPILILFGSRFQPVVVALFFSMMAILLFLRGNVYFSGVFVSISFFTMVTTGAVLFVLSIYLILNKNSNVFTYKNIKKFYVGCASPFLLVFLFLLSNKELLSKIPVILFRVIFTHFRTEFIYSFNWRMTIIRTTFSNSSIYGSFGWERFFDPLLFMFNIVGLISLFSLNDKITEQRLKLLIPWILMGFLPTFILPQTFEHYSLLTVPALSIISSYGIIKLFRIFRSSILTWKTHSKFFYYISIFLLLIFSGLTVSPLAINAFDWYHANGAVGGPEAFEFKPAQRTRILDIQKVGDFINSVTDENDLILTGIPEIGFFSERVVVINAVETTRTMISDIQIYNVSSVAIWMGPGGHRIRNYPDYYLLSEYLETNFFKHEMPLGLDYVLVYYSVDEVV